MSLLNKRVLEIGLKPVDHIVGRADDNAKLVAELTLAAISIDLEFASILVEEVIVGQRISVDHLQTVRLVAALDRRGNEVSGTVEDRFSPLLARRKDVIALRSLCLNIPYDGSAAIVLRRRDDYTAGEFVRGASLCNTYDLVVVLASDDSPVLPEAHRERLLILAQLELARANLAQTGFDDRAVGVGRGAPICRSQALGNVICAYCPYWQSRNIDDRRLRATHSQDVNHLTRLHKGIDRLKPVR